MMQAGQGPKRLELRFIRALLLSHPEAALRGALLGALVPIALLLIFGVAVSVWMAGVALMLVVIGVGASVFRAIRRAVVHDLPRSDFGMCPGRSCGAWKPDAFGEWIADNIDRVSGLPKEEWPLTAGRLATHEPKNGEEPKQIEVAAMTTDISSGRPYRLPMKYQAHFFSRREFERIMPTRIVDHLCAVGESLDLPTDYLDAHPEVPDDLHAMPRAEDFPVFLVARMSLSFPGLIASVPLWRADASEKRMTPSRTPAIKQDEGRRFVRCLFTDGGLSSNFPVHFFDNIIPSKPTLGIALGELDQAEYDHPTRHRFLTDEQTSETLPARRIESVPDFAFAMLNTAKDWQDTLRAMLRGYRDRNVYIMLKPDEGGINLGMDRATVDRLAEYGRAAGAALVARFDFDEHRRERVDAATPKIVDMLKEIAEVATGPDQAAFASAMKAVGLAGTSGFHVWRGTKLLPRLVSLAGLSVPPLTVPKGFPEVSARVRLRAEET